MLFSLCIMKRIEFSTPPAAAGKRLDVVVLDLLGPDFSRAEVQRLLKQGHVMVDGSVARPSQKAREGQAVAVSLPEPEPTELVPEPMDLDILYEDEHLIVLNKAPGVVVHPSPGHASGTLVHGLLHHCGGLAAIGGKERPGIVHRLDMDTSGAMVVAKDDATHRGLVMRFAAGRVAKQYLALVYGHPPATGRADSGIGRHPKDRKRMSSKGRHTKPALSEWRVTRYFGCGVSLLRVSIHTGRTHQIRVHMSEAGHPVVGDKMYGGRRGRKQLPGPVGAAAGAAARQLLHAAELRFEHPINKQPINVLAPLPDDFRAVLRALENSDEQDR